MQALYGFAFYLWKTILPTSLSPLYELPIRFDPLSWPFLLSALAMVTGSLVVFVARRRWPALLAVWLCYLLMLAPVSGFVRVGPAIVTDRYSYLACLGWAVLAGAALLFLWRAWTSGRVNQSAVALCQGLIVLILIAMAQVSWTQTQIWHDSERLWRHALSIDLDSGLARHYLGTVLLSQGSFDEAIEHFKQAAPRIDPIYSAHAEAYYNYGFALAQRGEVAEAVRQFHRSLELQPNQTAAHFNLGNAFVQQGKLDQAAEQFRQALRLSPGFTKAYHNLGRVVAAQGQTDQAIAYFKEAVRIDPNFAAAHESLGRALAEQGKKSEAAEHFQAALRLLQSSRAATSN